MPFFWENIQNMCCVKWLPFILGLFVLLNPERPFEMNPPPVVDYTVDSMIRNMNWL